MDLQRTVDDALKQRAEIAAIACVDADSGMVISAATREIELDDAVAVAATCANDFCSQPDGAWSDETFVVGGRWMHVLVRAPERPSLVVVGVAPAAGNLALLASCTREVARAVGR
jgi:hypothetical protein